MGIFVTNRVFKLLQNILYWWFHTLSPNNFKKHQICLFIALEGIKEGSKVIFKDKEFKIELNVGREFISIEIRSLEEGKNLEALIGVFDLIMKDMKQKEPGMDMISIESSGASIKFEIPTQYI